MKYQRMALFCTFFIMTTPAFAYIDPGAGSMWLQMIIALAAGVGVSCKVYWQRLKEFIFRSKREPKVPQKTKNDSL